MESLAGIGTEERPATVCDTPSEEPQAFERERQIFQPPTAEDAFDSSRVKDDDASSVNGGDEAAADLDFERGGGADSRDEKATGAGAQREISKLSRALVQAHRDHARELEQALAAREELSRANETFTRQLGDARAHHRQEIEEFTAHRDELTVERDRLAAELGEWRTHYKREVEGLTRERDDAGRDRDQLRAKLDEALEKHRNAVHSLSTQKDALAAERCELSTALAQSCETHRKQIEAATAERDATAKERDDLDALLARTREDHKAEMAALTTRNESVVQERFRVSSEFSTFREAHEVEEAALHAEREKLAATEGELRAHIAVLKETHRHDLDAARREQSAVLNECAEARSLLESDRAAWRKQIALFTEERETLARERDEVVAELARERQSAEKQTALRAEECANLAKQRENFLQQLGEQRDAQKRQCELFEEERKVLVRERNELAAKLDESLRALGEGRGTLVQQRNEAEQALVAAKEAHRREIDELANERAAAVAERDAARRELELFHAAEVRERASFGVCGGRKYETKSEMARDGLHMTCEARDTALGRDVELRTIRGGGSSDERRSELIDEARAIAQLQHPNIPPIYELGFDEDGRVFYTMKAVRGMSLREVLDELKKGRTGSLLHFSLRRLLGIFHRVCDALAFAHAKDVTHADVRPEHIVLGDFGEVFVTGWGTARAADADGEPAQDFHPREDIIALGRILYEIATLENPAGEHSPDTDGHHAHIRGASKRAWKDEKGVEGLADTARRAMNRKAAEKFFSVRELQLHVDSFRDNFEHEARLTVRRVFRLWFRRRKTAAIATAAILAIVAIVAGVLAIQNGWLGNKAANSAKLRPQAQAEIIQGPRLPAPAHPPKR
ncbi:MAG TPA: protein kinase [Chthoniobacteraceae bacterium]|nr:protein kinase [Chthoniobacteraceae bacterium]